MLSKNAPLNLSSDQMAKGLIYRQKFDCVRSNAGRAFERTTFDRTTYVRPQQKVTAQPGSDETLPQIAG
jgi:hypothetical protein